MSFPLWTPHALWTIQPTASLSRHAPPPTCSYYMSLGILCGLILAAMPWAATGLSSQLGRARKENVSFAQLFKCVGPARCCGCQLLSARGRATAASGSAAVSCIGTTRAPPHFDRRNKPNVNILSMSRVFLFGARDLWFEVRQLDSSLPLLSPHLASSLCQPPLRSQPPMLCRAGAPCATTRPRLAAHTSLTPPCMCRCRCPSSCAPQTLASAGPAPSPVHSWPSGSLCECSSRCPAVLHPIHPPRPPATKKCTC